MNIDPADLRLTAYVLGELPADQAAELDRAAAADPAIRAALERTYQLHQELRADLAPHAPSLLPAQRESILEAARTTTRQASARPRWLLPMVAGVAALLLVFFLIRSPKESSTASTTEAPTASNTWATSAPAFPAPRSASQPKAAPPADPLPLAAAVLPLPGPPLAAQGEILSENSALLRDRNKTLTDDPTGFLPLVAKRLATARDWDPSKLPDVTTRPAFTTAATPQLTLPVLAGRSSLGWIQASVEANALPPTKAVRLEELLNAFPLTPTGSSALAKGTSLSLETLACPWKPSAVLLIVRIQGANDGPRTITPTLHLNPAAVSKYRLLGFDPVVGLETAAPLHLLPAKTGTTLLLELEPIAAAKALGEIRWQIDGTDAPALAIVRTPDAEPSNDARFAALLAAWSHWLTGESPNVIDIDFVGSLGRECAAADLPKDQADTLVLLAKSLELAEVPSQQ